MTMPEHPAPTTRRRVAGALVSAAPPTRRPLPPANAAGVPTGAPRAPHGRKNDDYADLRAIIQQRGLLDRQHGYFARKTLITLGLVASGAVSVVLVGNSWWQLLNAVWLGFVFTQCGLLGHDIGHRQVLRTGWLADALGLTFGNVLVGISRGFWVDKHNRHHSHANEPGHDPDIDLPLLAFSPEEALAKRGLARACVRRQHILLFPLMTGLAFVFHINSVAYLLRAHRRQRLLEALTLAAHGVLYAILVFSAMSLDKALVFILVQQMLFGLYMGSIFAPNHKGMPLWTSDQPADFLRQQALTARNVVGRPLTDFWYGGLNYQIEHHLFPTMPRNHLRAAQPIVRAFCAARNIAYHETSVVQSYREITASLREIAGALGAAAGPSEQAGSDAEAR